MQTYVTDKELKQQGFRINRQNIQKATGIQVTFISEVKLQKETFLAKYDYFSPVFASIFNPQLGLECAYVCPDLEIEEEGI